MYAFVYYYYFWPCWAFVAAQWLSLVQGLGLPMAGVSLNDKHGV